MAVRTRSQQDAYKVHEQVKAVKNQDRDWKRRYGVLAHKFAIMVRQNGLQQTIGFLEGKAKGDGETPEGRFLRHLCELLDLPSERPSERLAAVDLTRYRHYTRRSLEVAIWYRRFVESLLDVDLTQE